MTNRMCHVREGLQKNQYCYTNSMKHILRSSIMLITPSKTGGKEGPKKTTLNRVE